MEEEEDVEDIMMNTNDKQDNGGWRKVVTTFDSGSADHVCPEEEFPSVKMEPSQGSKKGRKYVAANGHKVPNMGQKKMPMITEDGKQLMITWQVTKVVKPLLSVSKLTENGNMVILDNMMPRIVSRDGHITWLRKKNGTYECDLWIKDFQRQ